MKRIMVALLLVAGIVAALSAFEGMKEHQGKDFEHGQGMMRENMENQPGMGDGFGMLPAELELTDAQKEQIENLQINHKKEMIQLKADIDILQVDKHKAMQDHDFKELKKLTGKIFDLKKSIAIKQVEHQEAIWNVLTPEQQAKADGMKQDKPCSKMQGNKKMMNCDKMPGTE
ncbi:MAG: Spy/CpxP family protein refolding chaperone [Candidatus Cloacimonadales bacterium]|nr:Spy/CpxP family protein refolding chaperone [Candidatus Cloacimonadales bacterium]